MKSSENLEMPNFIEARSDFIEVSASTNQPSYDDNNTSELNVQQQGSKDEFVYQGIETVHTFEKMEQANNLIGGSTIATKQQESPTSKTKTHYISVEDVDDEDTRQFRDYKDYNKDHKVFAFSLPLGQNNNASNDVSPISKFKIIKPETASEEEVCKIKHKLKKSDSIDSLEELVLFSNEKGIASGRAAAIRGVIPINDLKRQVKELTIDKTDDGYSYRRLDSIWNELEGDVVIMGG